MDFEWDETKASTNQKKHGVSFVEASEVFNDDFSSCVPDPDQSYGEERYLIFGVSAKSTPLWFLSQTGAMLFALFRQGV